MAARASSILPVALSMISAASRVRRNFVKIRHERIWVGLRTYGIDLMKAVNVWRIEDAPVRRVLLRRATGCTTSEKEHSKHKE